MSVLVYHMDIQNNEDFLLAIPPSMGDAGETLTLLHGLPITPINLLHLFQQLLTPRPRNLTLDISVLENMKRRHLAHTQLLGNIRRTLRVVLVKPGLGELLDELLDIGSDGFAL